MILMYLVTMTMISQNPDNGAPVFEFIDVSDPMTVESCAEQAKVYQDDETSPIWAVCMPLSDEEDTPA